MSSEWTRRQMAASLMAPALAGAAADTPPNILLMLSDDHSYPYAGCYGDKVIRTPNLDRFAGESMRFDNAFTAAPQCVPSRAAIITGRSPVAARIARFSSPLPPDIVTAPELLREQRGYFCGVSRRYFHLDGVINPGPVTQEIYERNNLRTFKNRVDFYDRSGSREKSVPVFESFLDQAKQKPWFMWMSFNDPHHIWDRTGVHDPKEIRPPRHLPDLPGIRDDLSRYYDEINRLDGEVQGVLDVLQRRKLAESTMVIFMGDNGMAFPHGKGSLYDPGLHVPLMIRWPGRVKAGSVAPHLVSGEDITPTILDAAGIAKAKGMSGQSHLKLLRGDAGYQPSKYIFGARGHHGNGNYTEETKSATWDLSRCVRSRTWKLIYNCTPWMEYQPVDSARDPGWQQMVAAHQAGTLAPEFERAYFTRPRPVVELYDLERDPAELNNLAGKPEHAGVERELKIALQEKMIVDYDFLPLPMTE